MRKLLLKFLEKEIKNEALRFLKFQEKAFKIVGGYSYLGKCYDANSLYEVFKFEERVKPNRVLYTMRDMWKKGFRSGKRSVEKQNVA